MDRPVTLSAGTVEASVRPPTDWYHSLRFRIAAGLVLILVFMIVAVVVANQTLGRSTLIEKNFDILVQAGNRLVTELGQQIESAESLTRSLANLGERLPLREDLYRRIVPHLMDYDGLRDIVAGGGIWPEPRMFDPSRERRSFFWGREPGGELKYYDDYNDPTGSGYHHEEWYVPAKYIGNDRCFWSKSYMDPYSFEPMVTCTVPMLRGDVLLGVATIDVKLKGLERFFATRMKGIGGYAFAVDRNNKFLSFPDSQLAKVYKKAADGKVSEDFITTEQLATKQAVFRPIAEQLAQMSLAVEKNAQTNPRYDAALAQRIDNESYQINETEAKLIVATLLDPVARSDSPLQKTYRLSLPDDLLLKAPVMVSMFLMPKTYWKIVVVTPQQIATASADKVTARIVMVLVAVLLISMTGVLLWLRRKLVQPLQTMAGELKTADHADSGSIVTLDDRSQDEIGELAYHFNQRSIALKNFHAALKESETKFRSIAETAKDAIIVFDTSGTVVSCNEATGQMFGLEDKGLVDRNMEALIPKWSALVSNAGDQRHHQFELEGCKGDGTLFPIEVSVSNWETSTGRFYGCFVRDITVRKRYEQQIEHLASHDALTRLPNRVLFQDRLQHSLSQARRHGTKVALLFLDLDNFKEVNDTLGHDTGDRLLRKVAARLAHRQRESDTIVRLGGDEFAIILSDIKETSAVEEVAKRIIATLAHRFRVDGNDIYIGVSIGITIFPDDDAQPKQLIKNADIAMYRAKAEGRNTFRFFSADMDVELKRRKEIAGELRRALDRGEFFLQYQPLIDAATGDVSSAEALIRWRRPGHGMVSPAHFIPVAEQSGLIIPMEEWVLDTVCAQQAAWIAENRNVVSISVNVSSVHFLQPQFVRNVEALLRRYALPPGLIQIEITESLLLQDVEVAADALMQLRELGIKQAIDDFGTGYSSLGYLKELAVDVLKIDRSFVKDLGVSQNSIPIINAIVALGHSLGMRVVAEGVETSEQADKLRAAGCDVFQGFLFFRPLDVDDLIQLLSSSGSKVSSTGT